MEIYRENKASASGLDPEAVHAGDADRPANGADPGDGLGPFTFLPDLFAAIAVVMLLYQSYQ
jgi:hypothetical protein